MHRTNLHNSKKEIEKRIYDFLWEGKKIHPPGHLVQLPIWKGGLGGIVDIDTQLNYLKIKWIQRLFHPTNALWKDLMLYRLNLILNSNQGLALFRQNQILCSTRHKNLQNHNNGDFFIQLLNARLHFTNNTFSALTSIEEILDQPLFLNPHTKLDFNSDNPYFYFIPPKNISDKFTAIRDTCRFLQLGFVSSMSFEGKLSLPNANYNRIYKSIVELIPNDWIQLFKTKTSQQSLLKVFNLTTEAQKKLKIFKNFQIKKSTSLFNLITRIIINLLKFISWTNYIKRDPILSPKNFF